MSETYGFVYVWRDAKKNRYYVGSHWGREDDGYICSSPWMKRAHANRPRDFKRRIVKRVYSNRLDLYEEENRWLSMIKPEEMNTRIKSRDGPRKSIKYYNLQKIAKPQKSTDRQKPQMTPEQLAERGRKISEAKQKRAAEREAATGSRISERFAAARAASRGPNGRKHTPEWKAENGVRLRARNAGAHIVTCPVCGVSGKSFAMKRWHFDNCRGPKKRSTTHAERWADPTWSTMMRQRLREGSARRQLHTN